jgi:TolA-binding protein
MFRAMAWVFTVLGGFLIGSFFVLQNQRLLHYCESKPQSWAGRNLPYVVGHLYFSANRFKMADPYFLFVAKYDPDSPRAEEARYYRLQGLRLDGRATTADYDDYLQRYPNGRNSSLVRRWLNQAQQHPLAGSH